MSGDPRPPHYPHELAIADLILLLFAVAAVLQPDSIGLRPKLTGSLALALVGGFLLRNTARSGYLPGRATNPRLDGARNISGWITVVLLVLDVAAVIALLAS